MTVQTATATATATAVTGTRVEWAPVPRVNLLPPEILQGRKFASLQRKLGVGIALVAVSCGGALWWAASGVSSARTDLDAATATHTTLQADKAKYAAVPAVLAQVEAVRTVRDQAMSTDVLWYRVLNDLALATPQNVWVKSAAFSVPATIGGGAPAGAAGKDALSPVSIGGVTLSGESSGMSSLAGWMESLDGVAPFDGTTVASIQHSGKPGDPSPNQITFNGSAVLSPAALSHRYDRKAE